MGTVKVSERNYGIDLLRIVAMVYVVILHCLGHGGILNVASDYAYVLEIACLCAVNIFGIISGYVSCDRKIKYSNLVVIWLETVFYGLIITAIFNIVDPSLVSKSDYAYAILPVSFNYYWYITAYFGMFLVSPILVNGCEKISKISARVLLALMIIAFSIDETVFGGFNLNRGYSVIWLIFLFVIGILIKKSELTIHPIFCALMIIALISFTWIYYKYGYEYSGIVVINKKIFVSYTSPTIVLMAILYLQLFKCIKLGSVFKKIIGFLAPSSLAIYLINDNILIRNNLIKKCFVKYYASGTLKLMIYAVIFSVTFAVACLLIDKVRWYLFKKLKVQNRIENVIGKIISI